MKNLEIIERVSQGLLRLGEHTKAGRFTLNDRLYPLGKPGEDDKSILQVTTLHNKMKVEEEIPIILGAERNSKGACKNNAVKIKNEKDLMSKSTQGMLIRYLSPTYPGITIEQVYEEVAQAIESWCDTLDEKYASMIEMQQHAHA